MFTVQKVTTYGVYCHGTHETERAANLRAESMALDEKDEQTVIVVLEIVRTSDNTVRIRPASQFAAVTGERRNITTAKIPRVA